MPVYLLQVGRKLHVFAVIHRDYDHAGHRLPEGFFQRGDEVGGFFHPVALAVHGLGQQLFADFCKSQFTQKVRGATAFLVLLCFLAFIQRIELLQDLGVFQLDDLAGKEMLRREKAGITEQLTTLRKQLKLNKAIEVCSAKIQEKTDLLYANEYRAKEEHRQKKSQRRERDPR